MARREELTNEPWALMKPLMPMPPRRPEGRGRPWREARELLNAIRWILRRGAHGQDVPARFPPDPPGPRRFQP
jgi:transposase